MDTIEAFIEKFPGLSEDEKLEVINYQWLFANAPESARVRAAARIHRMLQQTEVDPNAALKTMRAVARDLSKAIADRIARVRLISR